MGSNTYSAFMIGEGFSAFIDGIPDKCEHQWDGTPVHFITDLEGNVTIIPDTQKTYLDYFDLVHKLTQEGKWVSGGAGTCSKCNKIFSPPMY